jgi:hypothetical protein
MPTGASAMAMPQGPAAGRSRTIVGVRTTNSNLPVCREPIARCLVKGSSESKATVDMVTQNTSARVILNRIELSAPCRVYPR